MWNKIKRPLEFLLWAGVLGFVFLRLGPQLTAALGVGGGDEALSVVAFEALDGTVFTRDDLTGKVVLVNAWATWCGPCVIEMPGFQRVYDDYKDQGFLVLGVSRDHAEPSGGICLPANGRRSPTPWPWLGTWTSGESPM